MEDNTNIQRDAFQWKKTISESTIQTILAVMQISTTL
jgi:hypothetical protein